MMSNMTRRINNLLKPSGGISGESPTCVSTPAGFFFGENTMKRIPLTQGKFAIVDTNDYDYLMKWKWFVMKTGQTYYAGRHDKRAYGRKILLMHRAIIQTPKGKETDHRNHDGLDNRRCNLRECSRVENLRNQLPRKTGTSRYKGICRHKGKWQAQIDCNGKRIYIGRYDLEIQAAKAYDAKAKELFGEFACTNAECGNQYAIEFMSKEAR